MARNPSPNILNEKPAIRIAMPGKIASTCGTANCSAPDRIMFSHVRVGGLTPNAGDKKQHPPICTAHHIIGGIVGFEFRPGGINPGVTGVMGEIGVRRRSGFHYRCCRTTSVTGFSRSLILALSRATI